VGAKNWKRISLEFFFDKRTDVQCLHRWQKVLRPGLVKGPWTKEEDEMIIASIQKGISKWSEIGTPICSAEFAILTFVCLLQLHLFRAGSESSAENGGLTISIQRSRRVTGPTTKIVH
jgi:hypothetical protein